MTIERLFVLDRRGRAVAFIAADDVVVRSGLDRDVSLQQAIARLTGKPIRQCQFDHKPGASRVIRCWHCMRHFTPEQPIKQGMPYHDAGWRPYHENCHAAARRIA